jgi:hypothetical protein
VAGDTHSAWSELSVRQTAGPVLTARHGIQAVFGSVALASAAVSTRSLHPGDRLVLDLYWRPENDAAAEAIGERTVFTHLVGPPHPTSADPVWAGQDGPPSSGIWGFDRHVLTVDPSAPPGTYTVEVGMYDPASGERSPVTGADADAANRRVILGTVEVKP